MAAKLRGYNQVATHWSRSSDNAYGEPSFGSPALLWVRWEDHEQILRQGTQEQILSKAVVFVPEDVAEKDYLALGDLTGTASPEAAEAHEVLAVVKIPSLRYNTFEIRAMV